VEGHDPGEDASRAPSSSIHAITTMYSMRPRAAMTVLTDHPALAGEIVEQDRSAHSAPRLTCPPPLVTTDRRLACCVVMGVRGEVDIATVQQFECAGRCLLADGAELLVVDLSETTFMDLSGVRATERLAHAASVAGGGVVVVAAATAVARVFELAAHSWLTVTRDLDTALEAITQRQFGTVH
jgi:anti-anti-sigma factor